MPEIMYRGVAMKNVHP